MIEVDDILRLMQGMREHAISRLELDDGEAELCLTAEAGTAGQLPVQASVPVAVQAEAGQPAEAATDEADDDEAIYISAPVVGVFYAAPSEEQDPYVQAGDVVAQGDVVCIIEAMKLMNEVVAERSGRIVEVLVNNGEKVEYGEHLFRLQPPGAES